MSPETKLKIAAPPSTLTPDEKKQRLAKHKERLNAIVCAEIVELATLDKQRDEICEPLEFQISSAREDWRNKKELLESKSSIVKGEIVTAIQNEEDWKLEEKSFARWMFSNFKWHETTYGNYKFSYRISIVAKELGLKLWDRSSTYLGLRLFESESTFPAIVQECIEKLGPNATAEQVCKFANEKGAILQGKAKKNKERGAKGGKTRKGKNRIKKETAFRVSPSLGASVLTPPANNGNGQPAGEKLEPLIGNVQKALDALKDAYSFLRLRSERRSQFPVADIKSAVTILEKVDEYVGLLRVEFSTPSSLQSAKTE